MEPVRKEKHDDELKGNLNMLRYGMQPGQEADEWEDGDVSDHKGLLSIGELARFSRTSRSALIFYDNMGIVSPVVRGNNNYRYYSPYQVTTTNLINTMQELEVPLKEIIRLSEHRTPEKIISLFTEQSGRIDKQIDELLRAQKLLLTLKGIIEGGLSADKNAITVSRQEEEAILTGPQADYSDGKTIEDATYDFYKYCSELDGSLDLNYPVWAIYSQEHIKSGNWKAPDRFYFKMPDAPDRKPAGLYATGCARGYYGQNDALYKRLIAYIEQNGLEICGPAYETYPLNEISVSDPYNYLMRISIRVEKI